MTLSLEGPAVPSQYLRTILVFCVLVSHREVNTPPTLFPIKQAVWYYYISEDYTVV